MIKDIATLILLILFGLSSRIAEWFGAGAEIQTLFYDMGISLMLLTLCFWAITEVKGDRVYIWLVLIVLAAMNPINLLFIDFKLSIVHIVISYILAAGLIFFYRKYR